MKNILDPFARRLLMRRFIFILFALSVNSGGAFGAQPGDPPKKRLKMEKSYPSRADYDKERKRGRSWIEADERKIVFYGPNSEKTKELRGDYRGESGSHPIRLKPARNGNRILLEKTRPLGPEEFSVQWEIYEADGSSKPVAWDHPGELWPSPAGDYFVGLGFVGYHSDGKLRFFGSDGRLRKEVAPFDSGSRNNRVIFSANGEYGVLLQSGGRYNPAAGSSIPGGEFGRVVIFDPSGNILAKAEKANWDVVGPGDGDGVPYVRVLTKERKILLVEGDLESTINCIGFDGTLIWSQPGRSSREDDCSLQSLTVLKDESRVVLLTSCKTHSFINIIAVDSGNSLLKREIDIGTGEVSRTWKPIPRNQWHSINLKSVGDDIALVYSNAKRSKNAEARRHGLFLFNAYGQQLDEKNLPAPVDGVDQEGEELLVIRQGKRVLKWRVEKESK